MTLLKKTLACAALLAASACGPAAPLEESPELGVTQAGVVATRPAYAAPRSPILLGVHSPDIANRFADLTAMFPGRRGWIVQETYSTDVNWIGPMLNGFATAVNAGFTVALRVDYARGTGNINPQGSVVNGATIPWRGGTSSTGTWGRCLLSPDVSARAGDVTTPEGTHKACYLDYLRRVLASPNHHVVHTWIIGNEMNMKGEALGFPGGQIPYDVYGEMYRAARDLIRGTPGHGSDAVFVGGVSPNAPDFTPDVYTSGKNYLTGLLYNLQPAEVGGIAIHAYAGPVSDAAAGLRIFRTGTTASGLGYQNTLQWIDALGYSQVPVLLSEWAANVEGTSTESHVASFVTTALNDMNSWNGGASNHDLIGAVWYTWNDVVWPQQSLARYPALRSTFANASNTYNAGNPDTGWGSCWRLPSSTSSRFFSPTGKTVRGLFLSYYDTKGGLNVFGYPISEEDCGHDSRTGRVLAQQWFQRHRMEYHPELPAGSQVALGAIGSEQARKQGINPDNWTPQTQPGTNCTLYGPTSTTGKWVCGSFRDFYVQNGGVGILGYPISAEIPYTTKDGRNTRAQWFERARLELNTAVMPIPIQGGLIGCEASGIVGAGC
jgi:hypothetical protein